MSGGDSAAAAASPQPLPFSLPKPPPLMQLNPGEGVRPVGPPGPEQSPKSARMGGRPDWPAGKPVSLLAPLLPPRGEPEPLLPFGPVISTTPDYGVVEITALAHHFRKQLSPPESDDQCIHSLLNEWYEFKVLGKGKKLCELLDLALSNTERFPVLGNLLSIVAVLPVSTSCCERGFSLMNMVKNKFRSRMQEESLSDLFMITMNGPSVKAFDPAKAVDHWYLSSKITRHVHGHKTQSEKH